MEVENVYRVENPMSGGMETAREMGKVNQQSWKVSRFSMRKQC